MATWNILWKCVTGYLRCWSVHVSGVWKPYKFNTIKWSMFNDLHMECIPRRAQLVRANYCGVNKFIFTSKAKLIIIFVKSPHRILNSRKLHPELTLHPTLVITRGENLDCDNCILRKIIMLTKYQRLLCLSTKKNQLALLSTMIY